MYLHQGVPYVYLAKVEDQPVKGRRTPYPSMNANVIASWPRNKLIWKLEEDKWSFSTSLSSQFFANLANILQLNKHDKKIGTSNMFSGILNMGIIAYDLKPCKETFGVHFSN